MTGRVYLDWNASAPLRPAARKAVKEALDCCGNPSSVHKEGRDARRIVDDSRQLIAEALDVDPLVVTFTSGATESSALVLAGRQLQSAGIEHDCVLAWTRQVLEVDGKGLVEIAEPSQSCLQIANGETGILQRIPAGLAVTDATQAFGKIDIRESMAGVDTVILSAHKIGGPRGIGAVIGKIPEDQTFGLRGGGQEFGRRSGTENVAGIAGFAAAVIEARKELENGIWVTVGETRDHLETMLRDMTDDIVFIGDSTARLPNTSCFALPGWKGETQVIDMDLSGIAISAGSACSSGKVKTSGVLNAMGITDAVASSAIRVSIGPSTTRAEIERFASKWCRGLNRFRSA